MVNAGLAIMAERETNPPDSKTRLEEKHFGVITPQQRLFSAVKLPCAGSVFGAAIEHLA